MISREQIEQLGQLIQNVNPDKHYWFFRTMGGLYYDEFVYSTEEEVDELYPKAERFIAEVDALLDDTK